MKEDEIRIEILHGLQQVDASFRLTVFDLQHDKQTRKTSVFWEAQTDSGLTISGVKEYD